MRCLEPSALPSPRRIQPAAASVRRLRQKHHVTKHHFGLFSVSYAQIQRAETVVRLKPREHAAAHEQKQHYR